ncbi:hypothetical protein [Genomoviridae sp.]|nr:hypothetical protein [Genomoviridae sp.]
MSQQYNPDKFCEEHQVPIGCCTHGVHASSVPTEVIFLTGKKRNKAFRTALSLLRENASLSEDLSKTHDEKENSQLDQPKEA